MIIIAMARLYIQGYESFFAVKPVVMAGLTDGFFGRYGQSATKESE